MDNGGELMSVSEMNVGCKLRSSTNWIVADRIGCKWYEVRILISFEIKEEIVGEGVRKRESNRRGGNWKTKKGKEKRVRKDKKMKERRWEKRKEKRKDEEEKWEKRD